MIYVFKCTVCNLEFDLDLEYPRESVSCPYCKEKCNRVYQVNIKGFDKDLKCRGFQFKVGKEYKTGKQNLELCTDSVFHYCESIQQVHSFYDVRENNRYCEIKVLGDVVKDEEKCGTNHIKIVREIVGDELNTLIGKINGNTGIFNTGKKNPGDWNSGDCNSGDWNSGDWNSGNWNSGDYNSGHYNSGHYNSGHCNSGNWNSGNRNSGNYNSGDWNSCNYSAGLFCNKDPQLVIFNQPSGMTFKEFQNSKYFNALYSESLELTYFEDDQLKTRDYKEACKIWWNRLTEENKEIIQSLPNFDKEIFFDITGIRL
jgi:hypothetical protein